MDSSSNTPTDESNQLLESAEAVVAKLDSILASRYWKFGSAVGTTLNLLRWRLRTTLAADRIGQICADFRTWKSSRFTQLTEDGLSAEDLRHLDEWINELQIASDAQFRSGRWKVGMALAMLFERTASGTVIRSSSACLHKLFQRYDRQRQTVAMSRAVPDPSAADRQYRAGLAREKELSEAPHYSPDIGLRLILQGDWRRAADAYEAATRLDATNPRYHGRLARALEQLREFEAATNSYEQALKLVPTNCEWLYRLGRTRTQCLDLDGAQQAYHSVLAIEPEHAAARSSLRALHVRMGNWTDVFNFRLKETANSIPREATFTPKTSEIKELCAINRRPQLLDEMSVAGPRIRELLEKAKNVTVAASLPVDWWIALHWKYLNAGFFSLAYAVKDIAASLIVRDPVDLKAVGLANYLDVVKAHIQLGAKEAAHGHLRPLVDGPTDNKDARAAAIKLEGDIEAFYGEFEKLQLALSIHDGVNSCESEALFSESIRGRSVAVVGPVHHAGKNGNEIDAHDVVIRTNFLPDDPESERLAPLRGRRTDISYFSAIASRELGTEVQKAIEAECTKLVVLRPFSYSNSRRLLPKSEKVRYNPGESNALLRARPFAIQRILHDVFRYRPSTVKLFNIDFFTTLMDYTRTYRVAELLSDISAVYPGSGHDYRGDFTFTKRLWDRSLIQGDTIVDDLLQKTPQEYLATLDAARDKGKSTEPWQVD